MNFKLTYKLLFFERYFLCYPFIHTNKILTSCQQHIYGGNCVSDCHFRS